MDIKIPTGSGGDTDSTRNASLGLNEDEQQRQETTDIVADMSSGLSRKNVTAAGHPKTDQASNGDEDVNRSTTTSPAGKADIEAPWATEATSKPGSMAKADAAPGPRHHRTGSIDSLKGLSKSERAKRIGKVYKKNAGGDIMLASSHRHVAGTSPLSGGSIKEGEIEEDATWNDVCRAMCSHSGKEWLKIGGFILTLLAVLYFFLFGLDLLGTSFAVVGGCTAGSLLGSDTNPLASVMIGIVATAILQSSSTTTSIIVSLVSGGLDVKQAIYMYVLQ